MNILNGQDTSWQTFIKKQMIIKKQIRYMSFIINAPELCLCNCQVLHKLQWQIKIMQKQ